MLRGVNLAGAEFGATELPGIPGTHFTWNSRRSFSYFAARGLTLIRLPLLWERLQPTPGGPLDLAYLAGLRQAADWAAESGCRLVIELHNFGRYRGYAIDRQYGDAVRVSAVDLANLWVRLSLEFAGHPAVHAYGLMNEPHDMTGWKRISQTVVSAIREGGDGKLILIPGDEWSSASRWVEANGRAAWITDPAGHHAYEAHIYFDSDGSGQYRRSYQAELAQNPALPEIGRRRLDPFLGWCRENGVCGWVGEYGVPADPAWLGVLDGLLTALDAARMDGAYWAAGEWWGDYPLSLQPGGDFTADRPQMAVLAAHLPPPEIT